jgi:hypothetical protein
MPIVPAGNVGGVGEGVGTGVGVGVKPVTGVPEPPHDHDPAIEIATKTTQRLFIKWIDL